MRERTSLIVGLTAALAVLLAAAEAPGQRPAAMSVTTVKLGNPAGQPLKDVPVTFAQVFKRGDIKTGVLVSAPGAQAQVDVKRKYDDGSVRLAVVSLMIADLPADGLTVELSDGRQDMLAKPAPVQLDALLKSGFDAVVRVKLAPSTQPDEPAQPAERAASVRKLLEQAGSNATTWLQGPCVTEWLADGPLVGADGRSDPDLHARFEVRAYAGCKYVRASVVVENCWDDWAGNIGYDVEVAVGGKFRYGSMGVNHRRLSRWRKVFWWPEPPPQAEIAHDLAYLVATGAVPNYDRSRKIDEKTLDRMADNWAASDDKIDIMGSGSLTKYMPTTGGRPEIGPYPAWAAVYLRSMDRRAKTVVLGNGDLAGSWPIHIRSRKTGRVMTIDDRPDFWFSGYKDGDRYTRPRWQPDRSPAPDRDSPAGRQYTLSPDCAHQPSLAYIPYLVTGDFYYLEEAYYWASYCLVAQWSSPRQNERGIMSDQIRGNAWGLRNIADAAFIASDGDPEAKHFDEKIRNNIAHMIAKMLGPPEYNKMGFWGLRTTDNARIPNPANPAWMITAPWEHDFLIWSLHHLTELGWAEAAKPRDFELRWRVGAFVNAPDFDPQLAAPYRMVVGEKGPDGKVVFYEDWKKLGEENARLSKPGLGYDYSAQVALAVAVDSDFPKAAEALKVLRSFKPSGLATDPGWAIVPRIPDQPHE